MSKFSAELLRAELERQNLTHADLGAGVGCRISEIEAGRINPSLSTLVALANALNVHPGVFFTGPGEPEVPQPPTDLGPGSDAWIAHTLASAPPLSEETARRVSGALFGATEVADARTG